MIIRSGETYKRAAQKAKLDQDMVVSIGSTVFEELMKFMVAPSHLAYELDHVGTFAIRHKNFEGTWSRALVKRPEGEFIRDWHKIPALIEDFKVRKAEYQKVKHEYKQKKAREESKG